MKDVGKLSDLGLQVGDLVIMVCDPSENMKVIECPPRNKYFGDHWELCGDKTGGGLYNDNSLFAVVSRATPEPKLWRDMTAEEKGALLLAAHEGEQLQYMHNIDWMECNDVFSCNYAYRIKPEPKVETVTNTEMYITARGCIASNAQLDGAKPIKLTYTKTDGVINLDSYKLEYR